MNTCLRIVPLVLAIGALGSLANGAPPQPYRFEPQSEVTLRFCLGPCLCPPHEFDGPFSGGFLLTFTGTDPQGFDHYAVTGVNGFVTISFQAIPVQGSGTYTIGGPGPMMHQLKLTLAVGQDPPQVHDSGLVPVDPAHFFPQITALLETEVFGCRQNVARLSAQPEGCYADCTGEGSLTIADFGCFQSKFAAGDPYADCNGSATLTITDFACFQSAFAAGCP